MKGRYAASERLEEIIPSTSTISEEEIAKFKTLKEMFPTIKEDDVFMTLNSFDWDVDDAINELQKQVPKKGSKKGKKASPASEKPSSAPSKKPVIQRPAPAEKAAPKAAAEKPAPKPAAEKPAPKAAAEKPAPKAAEKPAPVDDGVMQNISKSLEEQIADFQRQAALLISIKEQLAAATKSGDEAIEKLKKDLAQLEADEKRVSAKLDETRKKLATIDDKIAAAEKEKDTKVNAFINSCKDKGLKVKL